MIVGKLEQSINDYLIPNDKKLISIEMAWGEMIPEISEIILSHNSVTTVQKDELVKELAKQANAQWIKQSKEAFDEAKIIAQGIADSQYYTQEAVDSAVALLKMTYNNAELKADINQFTNVVDNAISNDSGHYSVRSYQNYDAKLSVMKIALEDSENLSKTKAEQMINDLKAAEATLTYSIQFREEAQLSLLDDRTFNSENYSTTTYQNYINAKEDLNQAIETDEKAISESERIKPTEMIEKTKVFNDSIDSLADINELKALVSEFDSYDSSFYTKESFGAYQDAIDKGKELLVSGTKTTISNQMSIIVEKKAQLSILDTTPLDDIIEDALKVNKENYTKKSYDALLKIVKEAQDLINPSVEQSKDYMQKITDAKKELVSIVALKQLVKDAQGLEKQKYTSQSYKVLETAMNQALNIMDNGSQQEVSKALDGLHQAIQSLQLSGSKSWQDYIKTVTLKTQYEYTEESYRNYKNAFDKLVALSGDISITEFNKAKNEFEKYETLLKLKGADYSQIKDLISQVPSQLELYDSQLVQKLKQMIASIDYNKTIKEQAIVDQYAKQLYEILQDVLKSKNGVQTSDNSSLLLSSAVFIIAGLAIYISKKKENE